MNKIMNKITIKSKYKFKYEWKLSDGYPAPGIKHHGSKVFSCFACGGGSTMGYKLAGYDVIGCNEIDKRMMDCYVANHKPKFSFLEGIQDFKNRKDLPRELYDLDILDGSPPCSSFSMAGNREKDWGKKKKFKEGQTEQILDTLFFDFLDLAEELKPKVIVAENVKGILQGKAKEYTTEIRRTFEKIGYSCEVFLLNAKDMGVPQRRERVFFIGLRNDLIEKVETKSNLFGVAPVLDLSFNEKEIPFSEVRDMGNVFCDISEKYLKAWKLRIANDSDFSCTMGREKGRPNSYFSHNYIHSDNVMNTIISSSKNILFDVPRFVCESENIKGGTFPSDYDFQGRKPVYIVGMSVPL